MPRGGNGHGNGSGGFDNPFLAVAFTDNNNKNVLDKNDQVIAAISDTNNDGVVSVNDTVSFGAYPHLDGSQNGTFLGADTLVTSIIQADTQLVVGVAGGTVLFREGPTTEFFETTDSTNNTE